MSLLDNEKKATSLPASKKERMKRTIAINISTVVAPGVIAIILEKKKLTE